MQRFFKIVILFSRRKKIRENMMMLIITNFSFMDELNVFKMTHDSTESKQQIIFRVHLIKAI